jgi:uncharacterized protein YbcI
VEGDPLSPGNGTASTRRLQSPRNWRLAAGIDPEASVEDDSLVEDDCPSEEEGERGHRGEAGAEVTGETLARISTGLVQLHSRYYGKGPTRAKTHMINDTVVCILKGGFTTVEETLISLGKVDAVYSIRQSFQEAMKTPFIAVVERALGRKVVAYMSMIHHDPDLAVELFVLEPGPAIPVERLERDLEDDEPESVSP